LGRTFRDLLGHQSTLNVPVEILTIAGMGARQIRPAMSTENNNGNTASTREPEFSEVHKRVQSNSLSSPCMSSERC
jgi:hypothetical protein